MTARTYCDEHGMTDITSRKLTANRPAINEDGECSGGTKDSHGKQRGHGPHTVHVIVPKGTAEYRVTMACGHRGPRVMAK